MRFNQITPDGVRVRQKRVREDSGAEVPSSELCKGYEYAKGRYVVLTDEELERIQSERDRAIQILHFAPAGCAFPRFTMISPISARRTAATRRMSCCAVP